jgi:hypothetical protein
VISPNKTSITSRRRVVQHVRGSKKWLRKKNKNKNVRSSRRKFAFAGRSKNVKRLRPVKQIERGRGRELAELKKLGRMLLGRGNTPVVPSRRRVLDAECYCIHKKL